MKTSTYEAILAAGDDKFDATAYVGTLENDGVGLAPFHNFEDKISDSLQAELDQVKADIISGKIKVTSYLD
jgi:basic membrane protein A